jgi:hypothetical protein
VSPLPQPPSLTQFQNPMTCRVQRILLYSNQPNHTIVILHLSLHLHVLSSPIINKLKFKHSIEIITQNRKIKAWAAQKKYIHNKSNISDVLFQKKKKICQHANLILIQTLTWHYQENHLLRSWIKSLLDIFNHEFAPLIGTITTFDNLKFL